MINRLFAALALSLATLSPAAAQDADAPIQQILQEHSEIILKSSRKTIEPAINAVRDSGLEQAPLVLQKWGARDMWVIKDTGLFVFAEKAENKAMRMFDFADGSEIGLTPKGDLKQIKPNSGIRGLIGSALVKFQLSDPDPENRLAALTAIERNGNESHLPVLRDSIADEPNPDIKARKQRIERLLTIAYGTTSDERIEAIQTFDGDLGVDARAALNPLVATTLRAAPSLPDGMNIARELRLGRDIDNETAYDLLVSSGLAPARLTSAEQREVLQANIEDGSVGGIPVSGLYETALRDRAYAALVDEGKAEPAATEAQIVQALENHVYFETYSDADPAVTDAARDALNAISVNVGLNQALDLSLDALSLASIYFLAAIGLAITFGVMGVINMAHGEFIMMGAYTGYVIQQVIPNYTVSIIVAIPVAFAVTFAAGVAMERLVIRWLYSRPLETLLATFGISIALQQIAKNVFGTQARPLTSPGWLDGAWVMNDVVSISYIRIAIFVLALIFLGFFLFLMKKTRLGLETRAVTQNPKMAASMGINPDRVNMLTFGLGSGIAGIAGVAIGLYAKVTSELGSDYIVQSFMTVVVGGVGNIWGTLLGATMIGFLQKGIEWFNPSNTLAAQTYMIVFIIIFIQFRPRGIIALKGRAAGD
jgi:urea transport system permease protein